MSGIPFPKHIRLPHDTYANPEHTFHIVFRAMTGTTPFRDALGNATWALTLDEAQRPATRILAACLMPDHFHIVAKPGELPLIRWVDSFKSYSTHLAWAEGKRGPLWHPGFYDHLVRDDAELEATIQYVLANPAEAHLDPAWPWLFERPDRTRR